MAPICDKLYTDSRMGTPVVLKQMILQFPVRPPAFTLTRPLLLSVALLQLQRCTMYSLCDPEKHVLNRVVAHSYVPDRPVHPKIP